nr:MAG: hypothetical protein [Bacteriophage sp.]
MKRFKELGFIVAMVLVVYAVMGFFLSYTHAATAPVNTLTMYFDNTIINVKGQNIAACRVQRNGAELIIPAQCEDVAAEVRAEICGVPLQKGNGEHCRLQPFTTFDFVIDGVHTGVI